MNPIKSIARKTKNHIGRNKVAYGMTAVSILLLRGSMHNQKAFDKFMVEKGINPLEFWTPEYFAQLNA